MGWLSEFVRRLLMLFRHTRFESDLEEEMRLHRELREQEHVEAGRTPEEAQYAVLRRFGNVALTKERSRDMWGWSWLESTVKDLRYGLRVLANSPGFTLVAIVSLALGIGANTAIFTLVDAVMLKSLPVANPSELWRLGDNNNCCVMTGMQNGGSFVLYSYPLYQELRDHTPEFSELAAFLPWPTDVSVRRNGPAGAAEPYKGEFVSGNYFAMFGIGAFAGRVFTSSDDAPSATPVAVMSYRAWREGYGLDPTVIGATFTINAVPYTVVGVAPPGFYGDTLHSDPPDFWLPLGTEPALNRQTSLLHSSELEWLYLIGRLKPGADVTRAQSHLTVELQQWLWQTGSESATPEQRNNPTLVEAARREIAQQHIRLTPAGGGVNRMQTGYAAGLRLLMIVAGLVLLIACANIANLLLARGAASRLNTAVRVALGAPRTRLIRQVLTESVLLALLGGIAGLYVAFEGTRAILLLAFRGAHYVPINASPSWAVLGFALLLSFVTGLVFGVAPAWTASRADPADALRGAGRSTGDRSSLARHSFVIVQVAVSMVLLIGAGLLTQSLRNLEDQQLGFDPRGRLIVHIDPVLAGYKPERLYGLYRELQQRLAQIPGVQSASLSDYSPMEGENWNQDVYIEGRAPSNSNQDQNSSLDRVSSHYFKTVGTRLLRGRVIDDRDTPSSRHVAVVDQAFARKFFPNGDPIGQHFGLGDASQSGDYEIVGIVENAKYQNARMPAYPTAFLPLLQTHAGGLNDDHSVYIHAIELRVAGRPQNLEGALRRTLAGIDPNLTVLDMTSFSEQLARNFNQKRLIARLTELFGLLALILACVGLYGVTSYSVARRANEIGIRMALGAGRRSVLGLVLHGALVQVVGGLAIGIPLALAGGRLVAGQLYGVKSHDPVIFGSAAVILAASAIFSALVPARRATKVDPMVALRHE